MRIQWRKNVLVLVLAGYAVLLIIFVSMMFPGDLSAKDAYDVLEGPFMALIGGSLALAKDLIDDPSDGPPKEESTTKQAGGQQEEPREPEEPRE